MSGASPAGARTPAQQIERTQHQHGGDPRELWPREFGRDGVSGLLTAARAVRARDVSRPDAEDERLAAGVLADLLARVDGRRVPPARPGRPPGLT